jgi:hypothetical protein
MHDFTTASQPGLMVHASSSLRVAVKRLTHWFSHRNKRNAVRRLRRTRPFAENSFLDSALLYETHAGSRAVPVLGKELTAILDSVPSARAMFPFVAVVEETLRAVKVDPLSVLSPWLLDRAVEQLDALSRSDPQLWRERCLGTLSLQMRRKASEHHAREQAARFALQSTR